MKYLILHLDGREYVTDDRAEARFYVWLSDATDFALTVHAQGSPFFLLPGDL